MTQLPTPMGLQDGPDEAKDTHLACCAATPGPAIAQLMQAHALLKTEHQRTQDTAKALQSLQSALHRFEQDLIDICPPAPRGDRWPATPLTIGDPRYLSTFHKLLQACNTLDGSLTELPLGSQHLTGPRVLGADSGVAALRSRVRSTLLLQVDGHCLIHYGLQLNDRGRYGLNNVDCQSAWNQCPTGLVKVLGSTGHAHAGGVLGAFIGMIRSWTDRHTGLIQQRLLALEARQRNTIQRQAWLSRRCEQALAPRLTQLLLLQRLSLELDGTHLRLLDPGRAIHRGQVPAGGTAIESNTPGQTTCSCNTICSP